MRSMSSISKVLRRASLAGAVAALALASALSSCNNDYGIYASIQQETARNNSGPFLRVSVGDITSAGSTYFARAATIQKSTDTTTWAEVSIGALGTNYFCSSMASDGATLYAAINGQGLYSTTDGSTVTPVLADSLIESVSVANGKVFIVDHNENGTTTTTADDIWTLKTVSGSTATAVALTGFAASGTSIGKVVWDGTDYWVITGAGIYFSTAAGGPFTQDSSTGAPTGILDSIAASPSTTGRIYVGSDASTAYMRDGGSWKTFSASMTGAVTALVEVPVPTSVSSGGYVLLAGLGATSAGTSSSTSGYYQLYPSTPAVAGVFGDSSALVPNATNYDTSLSGKPVNNFYYQAGTGRLFAAVTASGTSNAYGLWMATYSASSWGDGWASR